eukprot:13765961-Heterocapsa_arctica.AAC.1
MGLSEIVPPKPDEWVGIIFIIIVDEKDDHELCWASIDSGSDVHTCPMLMKAYERYAELCNTQQRDVQGGYTKIGGESSGSYDVELYSGRNQVNATTIVKRKKSHDID